MEKQTIRPPAEILYREELNWLLEQDRGPRPPGWRLSPQAVKTFIVGNPDEKGTKGGKGQITRKFYGNDTLVERAIVTLLGNRGLLLVGEPGTAKSLLSELLTAAISGDSQLTVQGTAGTTEDQIKYSWNYALLLAHGPSRESLVPGPVYRAMAEGKIVRFEEITRCQPEIQDTLVSLLSDKVLMVPELRGEEVTLQAKKGFNILATANLRDRGVNEMSSALKRRFNFETVLPIADPELEMEIVRRETDRLLAESGIHQPMPEDAMELLITTFRDLRSGKTREGATIEKPSTVLSTAEAVAVSFAACLDAHYFGAGKVSGRHISRHMLGTVFKDDPSDAKKLRHYLTVIGKVRAKQGGAWHEFYETKAEWDSN